MFLKNNDITRYDNIYVLNKKIKSKEKKKKKNMPTKVCTNDRTFYSP